MNRLVAATFLSIVAFATVFAEDTSSDNYDNVSSVVTSSDNYDNVSSDVWPVNDEYNTSDSSIFNPMQVGDPMVNQQVSSNHTDMEITQNETNDTVFEIPFGVLIVQDDSGKFHLRSKVDSEIVGRNLNWLVVGKKTSIQMKEEIKIDHRTGARRRVVDEDKYEELRVFRDSRTKADADSVNTVHVF